MPMIQIRVLYIHELFVKQLEIEQLFRELQYFLYKKTACICVDVF
jgi:hypothetical protein